MQPLDYYRLLGQSVIEKELKNSRVLQPNTIGFEIELDKVKTFGQALFFKTKNENGKYHSLKSVKMP